MRKSEETSNPESCLNKTAPEEPLFVLRANDELAPYIVRDWAVRYRVAKSRQPGGITPEQQAKYEEALEIVRDMQTWQHAKLSS